MGAALGVGGRPTSTTRARLALAVPIAQPWLHAHPGAECRGEGRSRLDAAPRRRREDAHIRAADGTAQLRARYRSLQLARLGEGWIVREGFQGLCASVLSYPRPVGALPVPQEEYGPRTSCQGRRARVRREPDS